MNFINRKVIQTKFVFDYGFTRFSYVKIWSVLRWFTALASVFTALWSTRLLRILDDRINSIDCNTSGSRKGEIPKGG